MATTPKSQANASVAPETITLPSGAVATKIPFKGKHVREASRLAEGDQSKVIFAIVAIATLIDGKKIVIEDLDEMDGRDVIRLISEYEGLF